MSAAVLEAHGLIKDYPGIRAVDGVDLHVDEGRCLGLLGPNGAGKTTTVEMLEGVVDPTAGEVLFRGQPRGADFKQRSGVQFQTTALQEFITVQEVLTLFRSMYDQTLPMEDLIKLCSLHEFIDRDVKSLSGGQRQRALLAIALVNDPEIVFLDEPTTGLDPQARRNFWSLVELIKSRGKTVLLTTHYMEEAYQLCDAIAIMDHGRIIAEGSPNDLLHHHFDHVVLELPRADLPESLDDFPCTMVTNNSELVQIHATDVDATVVALQGLGIGLRNLRVRARTLDDLFIELTGRELRT